MRASRRLPIEPLAPFLLDVPHPGYVPPDSPLLAPHPPIAAEHGAFRCGGWLARRPDGESPLVLEGSGDAIDGLRALCAAAWSADAVTAEMAHSAVAKLGFPADIAPS